MGAFGDGFCSRLPQPGSEGALWVQPSCAETRAKFPLYFCLEMMWQNGGCGALPDTHNELTRLRLCEGEENWAHVERR